MTNIDKYVYLIMVTDDNHNKYFEMSHITGEPTFQVKYGRVGSSEQHYEYPIRQWDSKYKEKIKKGYVDQTELFSIKTTTTKFSDIKDDAVGSFIGKLRAFANKSVSENYNVSAESVTEKQIEQAQKLLNILSLHINNNPNVKTIAQEAANGTLIQLYMTIPRKMRNTKDHLLVSDSVDELKAKIALEQNTLDVMRGQVVTSIVQENNTEELDILAAMGLSIRPTEEIEEKIVQKFLQDLANRYVRSFAVVNTKTQSRFDNHLSEVANKKTNLFWHGSRNENWWNILDTGLVLRPTSAVISGKMFGYASYMADKAQKSYGYTSGRGSYWAKGNADTAIMALFDVHIGNQLRIKRHENWCTQLTWENLQKRGNYDSVFAEGGYDLRNNEYMVYREQQSTIRYIVELKG